MDNAMEYDGWALLVLRHSVNQSARDWEGYASIIYARSFSSEK